LYYAFPPILGFHQFLKKNLYAAIISRFSALSWVSPLLNKKVPAPARGGGGLTFLLRRHRLSILNMRGIGKKEIERFEEY
jgi:hypothetical protein